MPWRCPAFAKKRWADPLQAAARWIQRLALHLRHLWMRFFGGWIAAQSSQGRRPKTHPQMTQIAAIETSTQGRCRHLAFANKRCTHQRFAMRKVLFLLRPVTLTGNLQNQRAVTNLS
jgi:hypothetical protein